MKKHKSLRTVLITAVGLAFLFTFAYGCGKKKEQTKETAEFNIGFDQWVGFAPFFLAKEKGYFGDLQVKTHNVSSQAEKREGLKSGKFQMICETMDMFQLDREAPDYAGKIVFGLDESSGGDGIAVVEEIKDAKDLRDKTIAVEPGSPAYFILLTLLDKEDMTLKDIHLEKMSSKEAAEAFAQGKVDAVGTYEPYLGQALKGRQNARLLVSSEDLPERIVDVAIVNTKTLNKRAGDIRKIYEAWTKAVNDIKENHDESVAVMAKSYNIKPEDLSKALSGLRFLGIDENREAFGNEKSPGRIFEVVADIGLMLELNKLTKAKAPASTKIVLSIINPKEN